MKEFHLNIFTHINFSWLYQTFVLVGQKRYQDVMVTYSKSCMAYGCYHQIIALAETPPYSCYSSDVSYPGPL